MSANLKAKTIQTTTNNLIKINQTVAKLDPALRAEAISRLIPLYFEDENEGVTENGQEKTKGKTGKTDNSASNREKFYGNFDHKQPKDNVLLIAAWLYLQHGLILLTTAIVNNEAGTAGLIVPSRSDNTMRAAKKSGKSLFHKAQGDWKLTVHGEKFLKEEYKVSKGTKPFLLPEIE